MSTEAPNSSLNASVKEAAERVSDAAVPVHAVTDVLEARLAEVVKKYDDMMENVISQYAEVLDQYVGKAEPIESRINRVINSSYSGQQVFDILSALEQETGITSNLQPGKILEIIETAAPKKPTRIASRLPTIAKPVDNKS